MLRLWILRHLDMMILSVLYKYINIYNIKNNPPITYSINIYRCYLSVTAWPEMCTRVNLAWFGCFSMNFVTPWIVMLKLPPMSMLCFVYKVITY